MTYLGLTTGPFLGGWLTDHLGWHFVFFINVPIALFAIWLSLFDMGLLFVCGVALMAAAITFMRGNDHPRK